MTTDTLTISGAPPIPGLRFRGYRGRDDHPGMLHTYNAAHAANGTEEIESIEQFDLGYATLVNCDPARDIILAEVDGETVAYARLYWTDQVEGGRTYESFGFVHPDWRRRGLGTAMHRHNEARLREVAAGHDAPGPRWYASFAVDTDVGARRILEAAGYRPVRYYQDMLVESLAGVEAPPLPVGIEIRPVTRDQYRAIWDAAAEAFRDEWGESEWAEEDRERFERDPKHADPAMWRVAWDGNEVAGVVITIDPVEENEAFGRRRAYVDSVSVRRPWRRRGVARALLASSLVAAREAGFTAAELGADSANPSGAVSLYESLGFRRIRGHTAFRKPL